MSTVTSKTCQNLAAFSSSFDAPVQFQPLYPNAGRARMNADLSITGLQYYNALTESGRFNLLHQYHDTIHGYRNNPYKRCSMANEELSIDADGNVYPCHMLHSEHLLCGNLNSVTIADIPGFNRRVQRPHDGLEPRMVCEIPSTSSALR